FFKKGMHQATMDDVTQEAKFSKATVYAYFNSKDELFLAIGMRGKDILVKMFKEAVSKREKGVDKVRAIGLTYFEFAEKHPNYYRFIAYLMSRDDLDISEEQEIQMLEMDKMMVESIKIGMEDGSLKKGLDAEVISKCFWAMGIGALQMLFQKGKHLQEHFSISKEAFITAFFVLAEESLVSQSMFSENVRINEQYQQAKAKGK
ncbi:MAG: TetR/AcrR family transcriptional regulator, partial [Bacteroidota bacterium]